MAVQIINNGATLKIITNNVARFIVKTQIRFIDIIKATYVKLDIGQGINNVFINQPDVTDPVVANPDALRDAINGMLATGATAGGATEAKQDAQVNVLGQIKTDLDNTLTTLKTINDKEFYDPLLVDESTPNTIYKGYALAGSLPTDPVWAISKTTSDGIVTTTKWAAGNKNTDKIWNNKEALQYS